MDETDLELRRERDNADRLAAALEVLMRSLNKDDSTMHVVVGYPGAKNQLTVGHVVDGALALHDATRERRSDF